MIQPQQVFLAVAPLDLRWGIERLACHVSNVLGYSPCDGTAYGFTNRSYSRFKLLFWDLDGIWLCHRQLHRGHFNWPQPGDTVCCLDEQQWCQLVAGAEWLQLR